jgi:hypothetical protein
VGAYATVHHGDLKSGCGATAQGCSSSDIDGLKTLTLASDVLMGVTIAAAVVTIAMAIVEPKLGRKKSERAAVKLTPAGLVF